MDSAKIQEALSKIYDIEEYRIVFWYDPEQEFLETLSMLSIEGVTVVNLLDESLLELKIRLETQDRTGKYLLYSPSPEPNPENDWLLDIRLYSRPFHADRASILLNELGLTSQSLRAHLNERKKFFKSQDRLNRLRKLVVAEDKESDLDQKMLAVLTRSDQASTFDVLMNLFSEMCTGVSCDFKSPTSSWGDIEKFGVAPFFWEKMAMTFGYVADSPSLSDLLIRLLVSDFSNTLKGTIPGSLAHFQFTDKSLAINSSVFIAQWRSHLSHFREYAAISQEIATELRLEEQLGGYNEESLLDVMTFEVVERQVLRALRKKIKQDQWDKPESLKPVIQRRRDGYWATIQLDQYTESGNIYKTTYDALEAALDLLTLRKIHDAGFSFAKAGTMYQAYTSELFRFDQLYRLFHEYADRLELAGWDVLKDVQKIVEACYSGWFLDQLSISWGSFLDGRDGLLKEWSIENIPNQQDFFSLTAQPVLQSHARSKVFVIVSDALRYEVAEELTRELNSKFRFKATISTQLGILPSYTALGMASLLPHRGYGYKEQSDQILIAGQPCATLEQRSSILSNVNGIAVKADELLAMTKDDGRELVRPWRVVYIYHNQIDATGDSAQTEGKAFTAVRKAIEELSSLVRFIVNSLNGANVFVTADHGFIYQDTPPSPLEKSDLAFKPDGVIKAKKRYILGRDLGESEKAWHGSTRVTAGTSDDMEFWIPKGVNRFHFSGGARFIHGGAMPQEIVVPVVQVRELEGKTAANEAVKQVNVSLLGSNRKIVNSLQKFELIQTEKVSDRMTPRTLVVSLRDGELLISTEEMVTFNSSSDSMEERKRSLTLRLKKGSYDNKREYFLVFRDPGTQIEYERIPMTIDLAFMNDF
ncbi:BREX-1 system phosphatase PglZ type A [Solidesulfovibrio magneticus]|uniref:Uncharacterized protein n=1 Tax=Solidesulfovibrio magneticus (strain ATCC 700980 / DSM 13731 / RS-1) TaxID=573370 RepID=C4XLG4_SOLM1|nr:BREX-1 system phosphatase PglZ type A [Solidesulfovibrio magneticus]BAH77103.1 hypothetical protein DMR_36120 [Solidesulfovibrio magneticus RS-1]